MLLAIDTSTRSAAVALADDQVASLRAWRSRSNHTAELMPAVAQLLEAQGLRPRDLAAVAVALGPGGFSALRVGVSAAKGLAAASRIPVIGVGTLDLEAFPFRDSGMQVCALLEAGRGEAASALFGADGRRLREDRIGTVDALVPEIQAPTIFCGEGIGPWAGEISERLPALSVIVHSPPSSRVTALAAVARLRQETGEFDDLSTLQPNYVRMPTIGAPRRRDRRPQASSRRAGTGGAGGAGIAG